MENNSSVLIDELNTLRKSIKNKNFLPFYFFYGEETHIISSIEKDIKLYFDDNSKINTKYYYEDNFDLNDVIKHIKSMPFMNDKKLIIFKNVSFFYKKNSSEKINELIDAFESATDINIVVIIENVEVELNKKNNKDFSSNSNEFIKFFKKNGKVLDVKKLNNSNAKEYLVRRFKKHDKAIDNDVLMYFINNVGLSLMNLYSEADKVIAFVGDKKKIDKADLDAIISKNFEEDVWRLIDLLNYNNKNEALKVYGELISFSIDQNTILSLLERNYINLIIVKELLSQSKNLKYICEKVKMSDWQVKKLIDTNKSLSIDALKRKLELINKMHIKFMCGEVNPEVMMDLIFN